MTIQKTNDKSSLQSVFEEINIHLLEDEKPSIYVNKISNEEFFNEYPFNLLLKLKTTEQSPKHHPEGSVWNHTMLVIDAAADVRDKSNNPRVFMWAALLHDIGKADTTKIRKGRITSYDHDKVGAELSEKFLMEFISDNINFIEQVRVLVRWHMQILFVVNNLPFADIEGMKQYADINEVALFGLCDRLGRLGADRKHEEKNINKFIQKINNTNGNSD
ncbi:MAG: HDIG domain-containing metalloprotein [Eubacteriaceae bacterium]